MTCPIASRQTTIAGFLAAAVLMAAPPAPAQPVSEPEGYRMEEYKAPVPATLKGARVASTEEARALWEEKGAIFVDVLPRPPKPDLPEGTVWQEKPHHDIPGSVWLADVGFGTLAPEMEEWYRQSLEKITDDDKARPLLLYCRANCWMSWNAGKRAIEWGYTGVIWYPEGVEGWEAAGFPLEERKPEPRPDSTTAGSG
jgi:PQQ-dependent catabolism-associated CXXCW motif protein